MRQRRKGFEFGFDIGGDESVLTRKETTLLLTVSDVL